MQVLDPFGDAILAYEMNGVTLPRDHGYPVRLLAPGHAGCRNVKWVQVGVYAVLNCGPFFLTGSWRAVHFHFGNALRTRLRFNSGSPLRALDHL
jgi:hypothetical protein